MASETKIQFAQIASDLAMLSARVDRMAGALASPLAEAEPTIELPATATELLQMLGSDFSSPDWAELFDKVADLGVSTPYLPKLARDGLASVRGSVRAAAARALAVGDEAAASEILPRAISIESNSVVASIMRSALASARL